jgi:hypothetical protein
MAKRDSKVLLENIGYDEEAMYVHCKKNMKIKPPAQVRSLLKM